MTDILRATLIGTTDEKEYDTSDNFFDDLPEQEYHVTKIDVEFYDSPRFIDMIDLEGDVLTYDETEELYTFFDTISYMENNVPFDFYETVAYTENRSGIQQLGDLAKEIEDWYYFDIQDEDEGATEEEKFAIRLLNWEMVDEHLVKLWNEKPHMIDLKGIYRDYSVDWNIADGWAWQEN